MRHESIDTQARRQMSDRHHTVSGAPSLGALLQGQVGPVWLQLLEDKLCPEDSFIPYKQTSGAPSFQF